MADYNIYKTNDTVVFDKYGQGYSVAPELQESFLKELNQSSAQNSSSNSPASESKSSSSNSSKRRNSSTKYESSSNMPDILNTTNIFEQNWLTDLQRFNQPVNSQTDDTVVFDKYGQGYSVAPELQESFLKKVNHGQSSATNIFEQNWLTEKKSKNSQPDSSGSAFGTLIKETTPKTSKTNLMTVGKDVFADISKQTQTFIPNFLQPETKTLKFTDPKSQELWNYLQTYPKTSVGEQIAMPKDFMVEFAPKTTTQQGTVLPTYLKTREERFIENLDKYDADVAKMAQTKERFKQKVASYLGIKYITPEEQQKMAEYYNRYVEILNQKIAALETAETDYLNSQDKKEYDSILENYGIRLDNGKVELPADKQARAQILLNRLKNQEQALQTQRDEILKMQREVEEYKKQAGGISEAGTGSGWKNALVDIITTPTLMLGQLPTGIELAGRKAALLAEGATLPTTTREDILDTFGLPAVKQVPEAVFQMLSPVQKDPRTGRWAFNVEGAINLALLTSAVKNIGAARATARATTPQPGTIQYFDISTNPIVSKGIIIGRESNVRGIFLDKTGTTYKWLDKALGRTPKGALKQFDITSTLNRAGTGKYTSTIFDPYGKTPSYTNTGTLKNVYQKFVSTDKPSGTTTYYGQTTTARPYWSLSTRTAREVGRLDTAPEASILKYPPKQLQQLTGIKAPKPAATVTDVNKIYTEWVGGTRMGDFTLTGKQITPMQLRGGQPVYGSSSYVRNIRTSAAPTISPSELPVPTFKPYPVYTPGPLSRAGSELSRVTQAMLRSKRGTQAIPRNIFVGRTESRLLPTTSSFSSSGYGGMIPPTSSAILGAPGSIAGAELLLLNIPKTSIEQPSVITGVRSILDTKPFTTPLTESLGVSKAENIPVVETVPITETAVEAVPGTETTAEPAPSETIAVESAPPVAPTPKPIGELSTGFPGSIPPLFPGFPVGWRADRRGRYIGGVNVNFLRNFFFEKVKMESPLKGKNIMFSETPASLKVSRTTPIKKEVFANNYNMKIASNSTPFPKKMPLRVKDKRRKNKEVGMLLHEQDSAATLRRMISR